MERVPTPLRIDRVSVGGGGVGLLVGIVIAGMLAELPPLRWPLAAAVTAGLALGGGLIAWRRR